MMKIDWEGIVYDAVPVILALDFAEVLRSFGARGTTVIVIIGIVATVGVGLYALSHVLAWWLICRAVTKQTEDA